MKNKSLNAQHEQLLWHYGVIKVLQNYQERIITNLIDDSLHQIKLALQRRVKKQSQGVEFHPHAMVDALRSNLAQIGPFALRKANASFS